MKTQIKQPQLVSHTIQGKTKAANQGSLSTILQKYQTVAQRESFEDEDELLQGKFETAQREELDDDEEIPLQAKSENKTGLPDDLKSGVEAMSGYSMDDVQVHYNSSKPTQLQALAYAQGTDIHVAPGQEKHLPHEAWHVVQQKQGRVQPTMQLQGVNVNDNEGLEKEADVIGGRILQQKIERPLSLVSSSLSNIFQLKSQILTQQSQKYNFGKDSIDVGSIMEVALDPKDMQQGQSANLNTSQDTMMQEIRSKWGIIGGEVVKGHLWNDNLGGSAMNYNLYPITKAANSDHLNYVENKAKEYIWTQRKAIYYKVEVDGIPSISNPKVDFDCEIRDWDTNLNKLGGLLFGPVTIESDLNNVSAYNEAYETYTGNVADRQKRPKVPKWAVSPKTRVGELTKQETYNRLHQ